MKIPCWKHFPKEFAALASSLVEGTLFLLQQHDLTLRSILGSCWERKKMAEETATQEHDVAPVEDPEEVEKTTTEEQHGVEEETWFKRNVLGDYDYG